MEINNITKIITGCAINIHRSLGPGLLESAYEKCLLHELKEHNLSVKQQVPLSIRYKNVQLNCAYRLDLLIENCVIVELKSVDSILPIHKAQLLSYLKLSGYKVGLLINFNVNILKNGVIRVMN